MAISKVGVIGAGVMGAGIAAHISNAGVPVVLLDVAAKDSDDRSAVAASERRVVRLLPRHSWLATVARQTLGLCCGASHCRRLVPI